MAGAPMAMNQSCFALVGLGVPQSVVFQAIKRVVRSLQAKANGATFAAINIKDLETENVIVPSSKTLDRYSNFAEALLLQILENEKESLELSQIRDVLLPKLMSGEIDVSQVDLTQLNGHLAYGCADGWYFLTGTARHENRFVGSKQFRRLCARLLASRRHLLHGTHRFHSICQKDDAFYVAA